MTNLNNLKKGDLIVAMEYKTNSGEEKIFSKVSVREIKENVVRIFDPSSTSFRNLNANQIKNIEFAHVA